MEIIMQHLEKLMKRNIKLLYIHRALRTFAVIMAVIVPFFQENGLSQAQIFIMQSLFAVAIIVLEVPSGYFADVVGRKKSLVVGGVLITLGFVVYSLAFGFVEMLIAEIILGFGVSFLSGADDALAYDTFKALNKTGEYKQFEARSNAILGFSEASASLVGGLLAPT